MTHATLYKNLIMTIAVLLAAAASAEQSFAIVNTVAYGKDLSPSDDHADYYSGYLCTVDSAQKYFGGKTSAADLTDYVLANYPAVINGLYEATKSAGLGGEIAKSGVLKLSADGEGYSDGQYGVSAYSATVLGSEYLALVLYNDGQNEAFRVFDWGNADGKAPNGTVAFDDGGDPAASVAGGYGAWTAAVPEPTSTLLLLLGLAGLALKRRRGC